MMLPCEEWSQWGFPALGQGWIGEPATWDLDIGGLVNTHLHFYQVGDAPTITRWVSVEIGPELFEAGQIIEWQLSKWDLTVTVNDTQLRIGGIAEPVML
jgi:hypothetical protein